LEKILLEDEVLGGTIELITSLPCQWKSAPHFSVSQSEAGFEKIMQAVTIELSWPVEVLHGKLNIVINIK